MTPPPFPTWLERMFPDGMRRTMIDTSRPAFGGSATTNDKSLVGDVNVHVMEWGPPDARPVLMLHGNPSWGFLYRKVVHALLEDGGAPLRLVVPDLVGLGCSDKPRDASVHTLEAHSRWIGAVIDRLDLKDLVFVGQDWGGPIGLHALSTREDRVAGMVILNTAVGPPRDDFRPTRFHRFARTKLADLVFRLGFPQNAMWSAQGDKKSILGRVALAYWWPLRRIGDRVAPLALARMVPDTTDHPTIPALRVCEETILRFHSSRRPMAIVWGDRDPVLRSLVRHLQRLLPQAKVTRTKGGHFLQEEVPREIAEAVRDVLKRSGAA